MELINELVLDNHKKIQLLRGDLSNIPNHHYLDLLVISAFPDDYIPTSASLIGSLHRKGISIFQLAQDKQADLRQSFHCWLSKPLYRNNIGKILCFEPPFREDPATLITGIYQSIMPFAYDDDEIKTIGMPLITTGDQGHSVDRLFKQLLEVSIFWLKKKVPFNEVKIVAYSPHDAEVCSRIFSNSIVDHSSGELSHYEYDYFLSYSRKNAQIVKSLYDKLLKINPALKLYYDQEEMKIGQFWQNAMYEKLDKSDKIITFLSHEYLNSQICMEEYNIGRARILDEQRDVVFPVYLYSCQLPTYMKAIQYFDAREGDPNKIAELCSILA